MTQNGIYEWTDPDSDGIATALKNSGGGGGATIGTAIPLVDGTATAGVSTAAAADDHRHPTDTSRAALASPTFTGTPTLPTGTVATTQTATDSSTKLATTAYVMAKERAFVLGKAGAIGATETNASDFNFCVPFDCTILRMKATLKTAATGSMIVQLRKAAATVTTLPTFSDVSSVLVTFASTNVLATATGFSTNLGEGDFLSFSCSTGSGTDLLVELVVVLR